jgi:hypothetical protein
MLSMVRTFFGPKIIPQAPSQPELLPKKVYFPLPSICGYLLFTWVQVIKLTIIPFL